MPTGRASLMPALRRVVLAGARADRTDGQLLGAFVAERDADAFGLLVRRHGPMVLGVCRRVIGDHHCAEDAFQAVFLVLARRAATVRPREQVGNWLYGVAYRTALKARGVLARRRSREKQVDVMPEPTAATPPTEWADLQPVIDDELARLPEKLRGPVVLCDIEGRPQREVARHLGVPPATLATRLATARRTLAQRLTKRGVALSGGAVAGLLTTHGSAAAVPQALAHGLTRAAEAVATGGAVSSLVSAGAVQLSEGVIRMMLLTKLKTVAVAVMTAVTLTGGLGLGLVPARAGAGDDPAAPPAATAKVVPAQIPPAADADDVAGRIDRLVQLKWANDEKDDATFLRRLSLDVRGVLPTDIETFFFVDDPDANKRAKLVEWLIDDDSARLFAAKQLGVDVTRVVRVQAVDTGDGKPRAIVVVVDASESMKPKVESLAFTPDGKRLDVEFTPRFETRDVKGKWVELVAPLVKDLKDDGIRVHGTVKSGDKDVLVPSPGFFRLHQPGQDGNARDTFWLETADPKTGVVRVWDTADGKEVVWSVLDVGTAESDADFLNRAVRAARGREPSALEQKYFTEDKDPKKREKLLDALLKEPEVQKKLGADFKRRMLAGPQPTTVREHALKYFVFPEGGKDGQKFEFQIEPRNVAPNLTPKIVPFDPKGGGPWMLELMLDPKTGKVLPPTPKVPPTPKTPPTLSMKVVPSKPPVPATPATGAAGKFEKLVGELLAAKKTDAEMLEAVTLAAAGRLPTETEKRLTLALVSKSADRKAAWVEVAKVLAGEGKPQAELRGRTVGGTLDVELVPTPRK